MVNSQPNIHFSGPGYITKAIHSLENGAKKIATSRRHRKGRGAMIVTPEGIRSIGLMTSALYRLAVPPEQSSETFSWLSVFYRQLAVASGNIFRISCAAAC
jgi:hypothetical protein